MGVSQLTNLHTTKHTDVQASATAETVKASTTRLYALEVDNRNNTHASYFKIYAASPTVGTTHPYFCFPVGAGKRLTVRFCGGQGVSIANCYVACVKEPGTSGASNPTNPVRATLWTD